MAKVRYAVDDQQTVREIHKVVVHTFRMGDVEDPDLYAAEPMWTWQESDAGKFVMKHAEDQPEWRRQPDALTMGYKYAIVAELEKKKLAEFYLRFGKAEL